MLAWYVVMALCVWIAWRECTARRRPEPGYVTLAHMHWRLLHDKAMALYYLEKVRKVLQKRRQVNVKVLPRWKSF